MTATLDLLLENFEWLKMTPDLRDMLLAEHAIYFCPGDGEHVACHVEDVYHADPEADCDRLRAITRAATRKEVVTE